ncbi:26S proteasome regulatory subunit rpn6, partial [Spiromyces aspiralis]
VILKLMAQIARIPRPTGSDEQMQLFEKTIQYAKSTGRTSLRQKLEILLIEYCIDNRPQTPLDNIIKDLLREMKKLDDQLTSTEIYLLQSRLYFSNNNMSDSRTALTNARTAANKASVGQMLQAALDLQLGILHCEGQDFVNANSCFLECIESLGREEDRRNKLKQQHLATSVTTLSGRVSDTLVEFEKMETDFVLATLKQKQLEAVVYTLLCQIMSHEPDEVGRIMAKNPRAAAFKDHQIVKALFKIADAQKRREFRTFNETLSEFQDAIGEYRLLDKQVRLLYNDMIEKNLLQVIQPYAVVEIEHIAKLVGLPVSPVESYLSKMILDKTLAAILDHDKGQLEVLEVPKPDECYRTVLDTIESINDVVDSLYAKAAKLA